MTNTWRRPRGLKDLFHAYDHRILLRRPALWISRAHLVVPSYLVLMLLAAGVACAIPVRRDAVPDANYLLAAVMLVLIVTLALWFPLPGRSYFARPLSALRGGRMVLAYEFACLLATACVPFVFGNVLEARIASLLDERGLRDAAMNADISGVQIEYLRTTKDPISISRFDLSPQGESTLRFCGKRSIYLVDDLKNHVVKTANPKSHLIIKNNCIILYHNNLTYTEMNDTVVGIRSRAASSLSLFSRETTDDVRLKVLDASKNFGLIARAWRKDPDHPSFYEPRFFGLAALCVYFVALVGHLRRSIPLGEFGAALTWLMVTGGAIGAGVWYATTHWPMDAVTLPLPRGVVSRRLNPSLSLTGLCLATACVGSWAASLRLRRASWLGTISVVFHHLLFAWIVVGFLIVDEAMGASIWETAGGWRPAALAGGAIATSLAVNCALQPRLERHSFLPRP